MDDILLLLSDTNVVSAGVRTISSLEHHVDFFYVVISKGFFYWTILQKKGEIKMKTQIDYICLDELNGYEFGVVRHLEESEKPFEILVIDHDSCMVRTLDTTASLNVALDIVSQSIQKGFSRSGIIFKGIQEYALPVCEDRFLLASF